MPAPWHDLVSVTQYPGLVHELAMAYGDAFLLEEVGAFQLADFARRCKIDRRLLKREAARLAKLAADQAARQALAEDYTEDDERAFAAQLRDLVVQQAARLAALAGDAAKIKDERGAEGHGLPATTLKNQGPLLAKAVVGNLQSHPGLSRRPSSILTCQNAERRVVDRGKHGHTEEVGKQPGQRFADP